MEPLYQRCQMMTDPPIKVVIIEDHPVTRLGLADVIAKAPGLELLAVASSVEEYEGRSWPGIDVVLLDLELGDTGLEGPSAVRHLRGTGVAVLVVSMHDEEMPVLDAIGAGANGYLTKDAEPDEIARAVRTVASGGTYFSATVAGYLLRTPTRLTEREAEILRLVASGETTADIARQLFIAEKTVNGHLERIRDKTGYRRKADLTRLAIERGIIPRRWRKKG
jgi:DNA-binding NarL/FixJ family response regulator